VNLEQSVRWQHVALIAAMVGLLSGGMILAIGLTGSGTDRAAPWWVGAIVLTCSISLGAVAVVSLRGALSQATSAERLARGPFDLPDSAPEPLARLNARLSSQFGLPAATARPPMPAVFGPLVAETAERVRTAAALRPEQYEAARSALAGVLGTAPQAVSWGSNPVRLFPSGRQRFRVWEQLRAAAPELPEAKLNPWLENIAIYGLLAALIAIAVPIAQRLDSDEATRVEPTPGGRVVGKAFGLVLFGSIIAVLMIPVYVIGRRYAARLPAEVDNMGALARYFPRGVDSSGEWTATLVAEHVRDLVSTELGIPPSSLREDTPLRPAERIKGHHSIR